MATAVEVPEISTSPPVEVPAAVPSPAASTMAAGPELPDWTEAWTFRLPAEIRLTTPPTSTTPVIPPTVPTVRAWLS